MKLSVVCTLRPTPKNVGFERPSALRRFNKIIERIKTPLAYILPSNELKMLSSRHGIVAFAGSCWSEGAGSCACEKAGTRN